MPSNPPSSGRVLYISYDGLGDPLGRSQIMAYALGLASRGWPITLMSYEKPETTPEALRALADELALANIRWIPRRWHQRPTLPATLFDVTAGLASGGMQHAFEGVTMVHARSYISGIIGLAFKRLLGVPLLFDMRGFWADERVEGGAWSKTGGVYRSFKRIERSLFAAADAVVSLTHAGRRELETWPEVGGRGVPITVIPTCADLSAFEGLSARRRKPGLNIGYLGSLGGRYRIDDTVRIFEKISGRRSDARFTVLTPRDQEPLWRACAKHGLPKDKLQVDAVASTEVPSRLAEVDATISLIEPGFASLASCPTKFGESLAAGCPVVVNPGIGDCAEIVTKENVGVVTDMSPSSDDATVDALFELLQEGDPMRQRCWAAATETLSLSSAIEAYDSVYRSVLRSSAPFIVPEQTATAEQTR